MATAVKRLPICSTILPQCPRNELTDVAILPLGQLPMVCRPLPKCTWAPASRKCSTAVRWGSIAQLLGSTPRRETSTFWLGPRRGCLTSTWMNSTMPSLIKCSREGRRGFMLLRIFSWVSLVGFLLNLIAVTWIMTDATFSGKTCQLYRHDLLALHSKHTARFSLHMKKIPERLVPRKFALTTKVPDTKGCVRCCVTRNPYNGYKYLCGWLPAGVFLMQWYDPLNKFMLLKR